MCSYVFVTRETGNNAWCWKVMAISIFEILLANWMDMDSDNGNYFPNSPLSLSLFESLVRLSMTIHFQANRLYFGRLIVCPHTLKHFCFYCSSIQQTFRAIVNSRVANCKVELYWRAKLQQQQSTTTKTLKIHVMRHTK